MLKSKGNVRDEPDDDGDIGFNDEVVDEPVEVNVLALSDDDDGNWWIEDSETDAAAAAPA